MGCGNLSRLPSSLVGPVIIVYEFNTPHESPLFINYLIIVIGVVKPSTLVKVDE